MLERFQTLEGYQVAATDAEIGKITDVLFDDQSSTIRYLVCDTGGWFSSN